MRRDFNELLRASWAQKKFLSVGLDPDLDKIPKAVAKASVRETIFSFNRAIVDATKDVAGSYKPNSAFYEAHGEEGIAALRDTCSYILEQAPETLIVLDAKRADIGNTNRGYIDFAFEYLHVDAITLHPYLGSEALQPFLDRTEKGLFILGRTSNPGAAEFQELDVGGEPLYIRVAQNVAKSWNRNGNCGLVVGATYPDEMKAIRAATPTLPFLVPGVGAQGGDLEKSVMAAQTSEGGFLLAVGRAIMYVSAAADFAEAARKEAAQFDAAIKAAFVKTG